MNYWIEKTIVNGRADRVTGNRALGKALWSPQKDKRGADIYKNMRKVKKGDIVLHFTDNKRISGVSIVNKESIETGGIQGTDWEGPSYLIGLEDYIELSPTIERDQLLNDTYKFALKKISDKSEVFYNNKFELRQGAYLTPCTTELIAVINEVYKNISYKDLPHIKKLELDFSSIVDSYLFDIKTLSDDINLAGLLLDRFLLSRFASSLLTKPFVILTGLSGSGKTKLAEAFSMWITENTNQYCMVSVGADWTNHEPLLGFPNALEQESYIKPDCGSLDLILRASADLDRPYFLILDEMNMSHVERYFADFLSAMESTDGDIALHAGVEDWNPDDDFPVPPSVKLPNNLFIIGTVNIDETTYMFSPKVLDRANVIEFRVDEKDMEKFFDKPSVLNMEALKGQGSSMGVDFVKRATASTMSDPTLKKSLMPFFTHLQGAGAEFGYRTASEISRFVTICKDIAGDSMDENAIVDAAIMQKLLPKVHGSRNKIEKILKDLAKLCLVSKEKEPFQKDEKPEDIKYPLSYEKLQRMHKRVISDGFTSYAEA